MVRWGTPALSPSTVDYCPSEATAVGTPARDAMVTVLVWLPILNVTDAVGAGPASTCLTLYGSVAVQEDSTAWSSEQLASTRPPGAVNQTPAGADRTVPPSSGRDRSASGRLRAARRAHPRP